MEPKSMNHPKEKIYVYVDESGQDTAGKIFLVSVVVIGKQRDELRKRLQHIEKISGKGSKKWSKATIKQRLAYMEAIATMTVFINTAYFSYYENTTSYVDLTILTTAKAILERAQQPYEAHVYVDGLRRSEQYKFTAGLRKLHVRLRMSKGLRDQGDEFIRFADAFAGFARDAMEDNPSMKNLYQELCTKEILTKI